MKRILAMVAVGISLLTLLAACGPSSPNGGTTNQESPTATSTATVEIEFDMAALFMELLNQSGPVGLGDDVNQPFFSVSGQTLIVKEEAV